MKQKKVDAEWKTTGQKQKNEKAAVAMKKRAKTTFSAPSFLTVQRKEKRNHIWPSGDKYGC